MNARALFASYQAHPLAIDLFMLKNLGPEYYTWEAETVFSEALAAAKAPNMHAVNRHKIRAILAIHDAGAAFYDCRVFEKTVLAFTDVLPDLSTLQKPDFGQVLSGVDTMWKLRSEKLSDEVEKYIAAVLLTDGVIVAPRPLEGVNKWLRPLVPLGLSMAVEKRLAEEVPSSVDVEDGAIKVQLAKVKEAQLYSASVANRLADQLGVVNDAPANSRSV